MNRHPSSPSSSRGAVQIDIPAVFLTDALQDIGSGHLDRRTAWHALRAEYHEAEGHLFTWGHVVGSQVTPFRAWRIVPVALWERLARGRHGQRLDIPRRLVSLTPLVRMTLAPHLPRSVRLTGLQAEGRRHRYALFTLLLTDPADHRRVRHWLCRRLVPELLPELLARCEVALRKQDDPGSGRSTRQSPPARPPRARPRLLP
jgi:hypothetical protein